MERKVVYGIGGARFEKRGVLILNSVFRLIFLVVKFFIFISKLLFSGGMDNKRVIKE